MSFFNYTTDASGAPKLSVQPEIWWYPVVTVPLTLLIIGLWRLWQQRRMAQKAFTESSESVRFLRTRSHGDRLRSLFMKQAGNNGLEAPMSGDDFTLRRRRKNIRSQSAKNDKATTLADREAEDAL